MYYYVFTSEEPTEGITVKVDPKSSANDLIAAVQDNWGGHLAPGFSFRCDGIRMVQLEWVDGWRDTIHCVLLTAPVDGSKLTYDFPDNYDVAPLEDDPGVMDPGMHEKPYRG